MFKILLPPVFTPQAIKFVTIRCMVKQSAGILFYRRAEGRYEVLLVHPGGPFWAKKDLGSWSIPKGEFGDNEQPLAAAVREFQEEMGFAPPGGDYTLLGEFKQPGGKVVHAFALEADVDLEKFRSNMFDMEWPPRSGKKQEFPENDKAAWLELSLAKQKLTKGQQPIIDLLAAEQGYVITKPADIADSPPGQASLF